MAIISIRVSEDEKAKIEALAELCNLSKSAFVRRSALGMSLKTRTQQQKVRQLAILNGNIGRLGGLFKLWLMRNEDKQLHKNFNIPQLLTELNDLKKQIEHFIKES